MRDLETGELLKSESCNVVRWQKMYLEGDRGRRRRVAAVIGAGIPRSILCVVFSTTVRILFTRKRHFLF